MCSTINILPQTRRRERGKRANPVRLRASMDLTRLQLAMSEPILLTVVSIRRAKPGPTSLPQSPPSRARTKGSRSWTGRAWRVGVATGALLMAGCATKPPPIAGFTATSAVVRANGAPARLHVDRAGKSGPAIVLVHGLGGSSYSWHKIAPILARHHRVIMPDQLGFGLSPKPSGVDYSLKAQAHRIRSVMRRLGISRAIIVGDSSGGTIALHLAAMYPKAVRALVLLASPIAIEELPSAKLVAPIADLAEALVRIGPPHLIATIGSTSIYPEGVAPSQIEISHHAAALGSPGGKEALIATTRSVLARNSARLRRLVNRIGARTLIITCDNEDIVPVAQSRELHRRLARSTLKFLKGCNHAGHYLQPNRIAQMILRFSQRRPRQTAAR